MILLNLTGSNYAPILMHVKIQVWNWLKLASKVVGQLHKAVEWSHEVMSFFIFLHFFTFFLDLMVHARTCESLVPIITAACQKQKAPKTFLSMILPSFCVTTRFDEKPLPDSEGNSFCGKFFFFHSWKIEINKKKIFLVW